MQTAGVHNKCINVLKYSILDQAFQERKLIPRVGIIKKKLITKLWEIYHDKTMMQ